VLAQIQADQRVVHEQQAFAQRYADVISELQRCRTSAAFLAIDHDEIRQDAGLEHGLGDCHELPRVAEAQLEAHRLAATQFAQLGDECQQLQRRAEAAVAGWRYAVLVHRHATCRGDLRGDLVPRQNAAVARLGALAQFHLDHLHLRIHRLLDEALRIEAPLFVAATEVTAAQFPDQVTAVLAVITADAAFAGIVGEVAELGTTIERADRVGAERAKTHRGYVEDRRAVRLAALRTADADAKA